MTNVGSSPTVLAMKIEDIQVGKRYYVKFLSRVDTCVILYKDSKIVGYKIEDSISWWSDGSDIISLAPDLPKRSKHWYLPWTWFY